MDQQCPDLRLIGQAVGDAFPVVLAVGLPVKSAAAQGPLLPKCGDQRALAGDPYVKVSPVLLSYHTSPPESVTFSTSCSVIPAPEPESTWIVLLIVFLVKWRRVGEKSGPDRCVPWSEANTTWLSAAPENPCLVQARETRL